MKHFSKLVIGFKTLALFANRFIYTAWKVCKYGVFSGPYFPVFSPKQENPVFGHFSQSAKIIDKTLNMSMKWYSWNIPQLNIQGIFRAYLRWGFYCCVHRIFIKNVFLTSEWYITPHPLPLVSSLVHQFYNVS